MIVSFSKQSNKLERNEINYKEISKEWALEPNESEISLRRDG